MKKRIFAIALLFALLLPLVGCNTVQVETTGTGNTSETSTDVPTETAPDPDTLPIFIDERSALSFSTYPSVPEEYEVVVTRLPETVENPDDLPVLKWVYLQSQQRSRKWSDMAMVEINQMLADKDMPFRMQLVMVEMKDMPEFAIDWTQIPEATAIIAGADLLFGMFPGDTAEQYLLPITDYVTGDAQPSLQNAVVHTLSWSNATWNGEIYGVPTSEGTVRSSGWSIAPGMLEKWGLTVEDFQKDYWEMDALFAKIYAVNDNEPFLYISNAAAYKNLYPNSTTGLISLYDQINGRYQYDSVGACYVLDLEKNTPEVVNLLEAEDFRLIQAATLRCIDAGYRHILGNGEKPILRFTETEGTLPYTTSTGETVIPITESYYSPTHPNYLYLSGVAADTPYASQAIQLLQLIAEDEAFRNQLCFGKEGRDYKISNNIVLTVTADDGSSYAATYLSPLQRFSSVRVSAPQEAMDAFRQAMDGVTYLHCPVTFVFSGYEDELAELELIVGNFYSRIFNDTDKTVNQDGEKYVIPRMDETGYERMLQLVKDAGSERIRAALQAQLDAWLADHPDWTAKVS